MNEKSMLELPQALRPWLLDPGSFMQRLKRFDIYDARVQVLQQRWQYPTLQECQLLQLPHHQYVWVRDVLIHSEKIHWMVARTVFPQSTLTGPLRQLIHLKHRSLGSVLFRYPHLQRSPFIIQYCSQDDMKKNNIIQKDNIFVRESWVRRSLFFLHKKKLLLSEFFFPEGFVFL